MVLGGNAFALIIGSMMVARAKVIKHSLVCGGTVMCLGAIAEAIILWIDGGIIAYEIAIIPMLFGSGMVFASSNSLAMEEGRSDAGSASAILNVIKYLFAAIVTPLAGLGDIMHSTAIVFLAVAAISALFIIAVSRLTPIPTLQKH